MKIKIMIVITMTMMTKEIMIMMTMMTKKIMIMMTMMTMGSVARQNRMA